MNDNNSQLTEEDIRHLFGESAVIAEPVVEDVQKSDSIQEKKTEPHTIKVINRNWASLGLNSLKILGVFIALFVVSFTTLNFPALWTQFRYYWQVDKNNRPWTQNQNFPPLATVSNHLVIPKIGVDAPIAWNVPVDKTLDALEQGVAHYESTALPGDVGNVFITGHSSYYLWAGGTYKQIFALLDRLEIKDRIYVNFQGTVYAYEVTGKKVVKPQDLSVLNQGLSKTLSLMTCVPVGTNLNRLIVTAEQVAF